MSETWYGAIILRETWGQIEILAAQKKLSFSPFLVFQHHSTELEEFRFELERSFGVDFHLQHPLSSRCYRGVPFTPVLIWCESKQTFSGFEWVDIESLEEVEEPLGAILCEAIAAFWPILPLSHPLLSSLHPRYPELQKEESLTFYGGSFSPFHRGHLSCIQGCPARPLIVVPDHNPQKELQGEGSYWGLYQELRSEVEGSRVYVYPGFCGREFPNSTVNWLKGVVARKNLLMGDDCFMDLLAWKDAGDLIQMLDGLYVVPRVSSEEEFGDQLERVHSYNQELRVKRLAHHDYEELSSTLLRESN